MLLELSKVYDKEVRSAIKNLIALFEQLKIHTTVTDMSFSVQSHDGQRALEWGGANLNSVSEEFEVSRKTMWVMRRMPSGRTYTT